ncbi:TraY domain-containing protein [Salmonella enterica]|nr:TraY domain-containing protein [Salmonella enterica]ELU8076051.1 TraY domain-containing protein [Salmonella enterica]
MNVKQKRPKTISVALSDVTVNRLNLAMKISGRKAKHEVMIRLAHSLKHNPVIDEVYWEILQEDEG